NGQQVEGFTQDIMNIEPLEEKFKAFGAKTAKIDGHNVEELQKACQMTEKGRPLVVLCYTDPTKGIPLLKHRKGQMHFIRFKDEEYNEYLKFYQNM
ncbi:MAG: transketolase, partial [Tetragenococcus koreensis]|nr:transketolase [Tetragenococcus koreensis]